MEQNTNLLTYEEAAQVLGITHGSVKQAINRGSLHPVKLPGSRNKFLRREELERYRAIRPVKLLRVDGAALSDAEHRALIEGERASMHASEEALEVLRSLLNVASAAWLENAPASRAIAEANQRAAEALAEAHRHTAEAMTGSERAIIANASSIRDTLIEAFQFYLPLLQHGHLFPLPASKHDAVVFDEEQPKDRGMGDESHARRPRRGRKSAAKALADEFLSSPTNDRGDVHPNARSEAR